MTTTLNPPSGYVPSALSGGIGNGPGSVRSSGSASSSIDLRSTPPRDGTISVSPGIVPTDDFEAAANDVLAHLRA